VPRPIETLPALSALPVPIDSKGEAPPAPPRVSCEMLAETTSSVTM